MSRKKRGADKRPRKNDRQTNRGGGDATFREGLSRNDGSALRAVINKNAEPTKRGSKIKVRADVAEEYDARYSLYSSVQEQATPLQPNQLELFIVCPKNTPTVRSGMNLATNNKPRINFALE